MTDTLGPVKFDQRQWEIIGSGELEPGHKGQVRAFRTAFGEAYNQNGARVLDIGALDYVIKDSSKPVNTQLVNHLSKRFLRTSNHFWVSPEYGWLDGAGLGNFSVIRTSRAETSAHQVFFGLMHDGEPTEKVLPVAVKPCTTKPVKACYDWLNSKLAEGEGLHRYAPIGFLFGPDGTGYSITELERETETLDNSNWQNVLLDTEDPEYKEQREVMKKVAQTLADLHRKRIFHGDPQFKNIAVGITGDAFFIDWESADFFGEQPEREVLLHKITHDLKVLFRPMAFSEKEEGIGLLHNFNWPVQWGYFKEYIFDPYMERYLEGQTDESDEFALIGEAESLIRSYILDGEVYKSFRRSRKH